MASKLCNKQSNWLQVSNCGLDTRNWPVSACFSFLEIQRSSESTAHSPDTSSISPLTCNIGAPQIHLYSRTRNFVRAREWHTHTYIVDHSRGAKQKYSKKFTAALHITRVVFAGCPEMHHEPNGTFHENRKCTFTTSLRGKQHQNALAFVLGMRIIMAPRRRYIVFKH